jgi:peptide/nickel transport system permease protein
MLRIIQQTVFIFILILFLASLPNIIEINLAEKNLDWNWSKLPQVYGDFISEISNGSLGTYQLGSQERQISEDIGGNFKNSLLIMLVGVNTGVILSLVFGVFISRFRLTRFVNFTLNLLASIPDFIIIILSLILAVKFYKTTGIRIISLRSDAGALNIWFPMVLVAFAPTLYLFKLIAVKYYQISGEDYVRTAVAKGMRLNYINLQHVYKNIEPFIKAELTKVISLAIGNMFIVEYLLNVSGITKFIFLSKEIQPIAIGLFAMILISFIVYFSVKLGLYLFKRGFIYE